MKITENNPSWILIRPIVITVILIILIGLLLSYF